jgi:hypothetical protein
MERHSPRYRRVRQDGKLMLVPLESANGETVATNNLKEASDDGNVPEIPIDDQSFENDLIH